MQTTEARAQLLEEMKTGIGASEAAAAIGLSKYKTAYQLWLEKTGQAQPEPSGEEAEWGLLHEPNILDRFARKQGVEVVHVPFLRDAKHAFMIAHPDGLIAGTACGVQAKSVDKDAFRFSEQWGEPDAPGNPSDQVPLAYYYQAQHEMRVAGWEMLRFAVLVGGNRDVTYTVPRDEDLIEDLIELEAAFWRNVQERVAPEVKTIVEAAQRYPNASRLEIEATPEIVEACNRLAMAKAAVKNSEEEVDGLGAAVRGFMGEADTLVHAGEVLATWKGQSSRRFSESKMLELYPDVDVDACKVSGSYRRFLLKAAPSE